MKLIKPYFEIIKQQPNEIGMLKHIETCGRVAWKSEERTTEDSYIKFVDMLKGVNHGSVLEHGTVYLKLDGNINLISGINPLSINQWNDFISKYENNKYSRVTPHKEELDGQCFITTNYRVLVENNWLDDLKYQCEPTEYHEKRITIRFVCDRGVSHEIVRHRIASYAQESTRYCNYSKDKFNNEITVIKPCFLKPCENIEDTFWYKSCEYAEMSYFDMLNVGYTPQEARSVLPNSLKTEIVVTYNLREWRNFFKLRTASVAHPQMREITVPLLKEFKTYLPEIFGDIEVV